MKQNEQLNRRILIIDDTESIHHDFREILDCRDNQVVDVAEEEAAIFGSALESSDTEGFEIDSSFQGQEGLEKVRFAADEGRPYALAFIDIRMPPGWDGIETTQRLWQVCPDLQVVICSAHSDYQWCDIVEKLGPTEKLLILKKPYDNIEVLQLANALTMKWNLAREACIRQTELEQKTVELTRLLEEANMLRKVAEEANATKSEFLANMSHELRTPLHGILSFSNFGIKKHGNATPEKLLDYFEKIQQSGSILLELLNDLLDLAKLESGRMAFEPMPADLGLLVASVKDEFGSLVSEQNLIIEHDELECKSPLMIDAKKMKQVLRNLLSNAVKFSPEGGSIGISVQQKSNSVVFSISDQGPGIPENELKAVFDKFVQSSKTKSGAGGTGLGLAISREIVGAHNGRIWAENRPENGAIFSFEIPIVERRSRRRNAVLDGEDNESQT